MTAMNESKFKPWFDAQGWGRGSEERCLAAWNAALASREVVGFEEWLENLSPEMAHDLEMSAYSRLIVKRCYDDAYAAGSSSRQPEIDALRAEVERLKAECEKQYEKGRQDGYRRALSDFAAEGDRTL